MDSIKVIRIGHACVLIEVGGKKILTDPWFSQKPGYYRGEPLGMTVEELPQLDAVLVTHEHYDHYDMEAFKAYPHKTVPIIVRKGIGKKALDAGFTNVIELDHWQVVTIDSIKITATPAKHMIPENTYLIQIEGATIFFGGDTLLIPELKEVAVKAPDIDLALLPINGLTIRPLFNKQVVMTAREAGELCAILKPRVAIPIHYTFTGGWLRDLFLLKYQGTAEEFVKMANLYAVTTKIIVSRPGQEVFIEK